MNKNNNDFIYRKGTLSDLQQLTKLGRLAYGQYKDILHEEGWKKMEATCGSEETYKNLLNIGTSFVCEFEKKIIGMAFFIPNGNPVAFFQKDWSYIRLVGVDPKYEGKGIGRELTARCIDFAKESGENMLVLHTSEFQNAARHIYESIGFEKFKTLEPIHQKKYWLYRLMLNHNEGDITYHKASLEDLQTLVEMRIAFALELNGLQPESKVVALRNQLNIYFTDAIQHETCIFYVAEAKGTVVGIGGMMLRETPGGFKNISGKWGYLMNMYTIPDFRRRGICATILNLLLEKASSYGITAFELHATIEGEYVYKQNGFKMHDEPTYRKFI